MQLESLYYNLSRPVKLNKISKWKLVKREIMLGTLKLRCELIPTNIKKIKLDLSKPLEDIAKNIIDVNFTQKIRIKTLFYNKMCQKWEQKTDLHNFFKKIDTDNDGFIDKSNLNNDKSEYYILFNKLLDNHTMTFEELFKKWIILGQ